LAGVAGGAGGGAGAAAGGAGAVVGAWAVKDVLGRVADWDAQAVAAGRRFLAGPVPPAGD